MIFRFLFSLFLSYLMGFLTVSLLWPSAGRTRSTMVVRSCFAFGFGAAISSCLFFCWLCVGAVAGAHCFTFVAAEIATTTVLLIAWARIRADRMPSRSSFRKQQRDSWALAIQITACCILICALLSFILISIRNPHGDYDARAFWNSRARFLARGTSHWRDAFANSNSLPHPDYPPLLPATIASAWKYVGSEPVFVPSAFAFLFTFASAGVLFASLALLRGANVGCLGMIILLGVGSFVSLGTSQYADTVLAFFMLSSVVILALYDREPDKERYGLLMLAGGAIGLCAWTKNEGMLFLVVILSVRLGFVLFNEGPAAFRHQIMAISLGLSPVLLLLVYFKLAVAPPGFDVLLPGMYRAGPMDFFLDQNTMMHKIADGTRYLTIVKAFIKEIANLGGRRISTVSLLLLFAVIGGFRVRKDATATMGGTITVLMLAGYFCVYLVTPLNLDFHLRTSLPRLIDQLLPTAVFALVLATSRDEGWSIV